MMRKSVFAIVAFSASIALAQQVGFSSQGAVSPDAGSFKKDQPKDAEPSEKKDVDPQIAADAEKRKKAFACIGRLTGMGAKCRAANDTTGDKCNPEPISKKITEAKERAAAEIKKAKDSSVNGIVGDSQSCKALLDSDSPKLQKDIGDYRDACKTEWNDCKKTCDADLGLLTKELETLCAEGGVAKSFENKKNMILRKASACNKQGEDVAPSNAEMKKQKPYNQYPELEKNISDMQAAVAVAYGQNRLACDGIIADDLADGPTPDMNDEVDRKVERAREALRAARSDDDNNDYNPNKYGDSSPTSNERVQNWNNVFGQNQNQTPSQNYNAPFDTYGNYRDPSGENPKGGDPSWYDTTKPISGAQDFSGVGGFKSLDQDVSLPADHFVSPEDLSTAGDRYSPTTASMTYASPPAGTVGAFRITPAVAPAPSLVSMNAQGVLPPNVFGGPLAKPADAPTTGPKTEPGTMAPASKEEPTTRAASAPPNENPSQNQANAASANPAIPPPSGSSTTPAPATATPVAAIPIKAITNPLNAPNENPVSVNGGLNADGTNGAIATGDAAAPVADRLLGGETARSLAPMKGVGPGVATTAGSPVPSGFGAKKGATPNSENVDPAAKAANFSNVKVTQGAESGGGARGKGFSFAALSPWWKSTVGSLFGFSKDDDRAPAAQKAEVDLRQFLPGQMQNAAVRGQSLRAAGIHGPDTILWSPVRNRYESIKGTLLPP